MAIKQQNEVEIRVRYQETDAMERLHHANYINYFEIGRTELLRDSGVTYRQLEEQGVLLVVAEVSCKYFLPARYDDLLQLHTTTGRIKGVRIEHFYKLTRGAELLAEGRTMLVCVDREGNVQRLPDWLRSAGAARSQD